MPNHKVGFLSVVDKRWLQLDAGCGGRGISFLFFFSFQVKYTGKKKKKKSHIFMAKIQNESIWDDY